jgi:hypothetical protein
MNERIKELIVSLEPDAFMTYKGYLYHSGDPKVLEHSNPEPLYTQQELVKFAELIVRECASKVDWILAEGGRTQGDLIKEHFGVEE